MAQFMDVVGLVLPYIHPCEDLCALACVSKECSGLVKDAPVADHELLRQMERAFESEFDGHTSAVVTQVKLLFGASARVCVTLTQCEQAVASIVAASRRVEFPARQCWMCGGTCGTKHPLYGFTSHARCFSLGRLAARRDVARPDHYSDIPWTLEAWDAAALGPERKDIETHARAAPFPHTDALHARVRALERDYFFQLVTTVRLRNDHRTTEQRQRLKCKLRGNEAAFATYVRLLIDNVLDVHAVNSALEWTQRSSTVNVSRLVKKVTEDVELRAALYELLVVHNPHANLSVTYVMLARAADLLKDHATPAPSRKRTYYSEMTNRHLEEVNELRARLHVVERELHKRARLEHALRATVREKEEEIRSLRAHGNNFERLFEG